MNRIVKQRRKANGPRIVIWVRPVGSLEDPVPVPPAGGDDEPVAPTTHGELQRHARQGESQPSGGDRPPRRARMRARSPGAARRPRPAGHDLHRTGKVPAGPEQQVDLTTVPALRLNDQVPQTPLGQEIGFVSLRWRGILSSGSSCSIELRYFRTFDTQDKW